MSILKPSTWNILLPWGYLLILSSNRTEFMDFTYKGITTQYRQISGILYKKV